MNSGTEPLIGTCKSPCTTNSSDKDCDGDDEPVGPYFRHRDLERRERHDEKVIHGPMLTLAHHSCACEDDREHGDVVDDAHHARKPARRHVGVESDTDGEVHGRLGDRLGPLHETVDFVIDDLGGVARSDSGLNHCCRIDKKLKRWVPARANVALEIGRDVENEGEAAHVHEPVDVAFLDG